MALSAAIAMPSFAISSAHAQDNGEVVEEVVVTGSYIRRKTQTDSASPISVVDRGDLGNMGAGTIADLTQSLTLNNGAQNNPDAFTQNVSTGTSNINLRGLGVASTLVLLNGGRQVTSGAQTDGGVAFVDTSSLVPMIAVNTVEILKNGAAALYGSDAVGGVANFITRSDFEGFEIQGDWRTSTEATQDDLNIQAIVGHQTERVRIVVSGSYFKRTNMTARERNLRPQWAKDELLTVSTQTGLPGTFLLPTPPLLNMNDTIAFLSVYDQVMPSFTNAAFPGLPHTIANPSAGVPLPAAFGALGITSNPAPPYFPFPTVTSPVTNLPGSTFAGFVGADAAAGEGVINIPAGAAAFLGLGTDAIALGANGIADALEGLVYPTVYQLAAPGVATGLGLDPLGTALGVDASSFLSFAGVPNATAPLPEFPDPTCATAAGLIPDVVPITTTFTNPLNGETTQIGACGYDYNAPFDLVPYEERKQAYAEFGYQISDDIEFYGDFGYADNYARRNNSNFPVTTPMPIAANYPFNQFAAAALWLGRSPGIGQVENGFFTESTNPTTHESETMRFKAGLKGDTAEGWSWNVNFTRGTNDFKLVSHDGVMSRLIAGLSGLGGPGCSTNTPGQNGCQFYNVFGSGILADPTAMTPMLDASFQPILDDDGAVVMVPIRNSQQMLEWIATPVTIDITSEMSVIDGVVTGEMGNIGVALGGQWRRETLGYDYDGFTEVGDRTFVGKAADFFDTRDVWAVFTEMAVPLGDNADVQAALRYEDYGNGVGSTIDPRIAANYRVSPSTTLRGSWGTSFRAPSVFQLYGNQTTLQQVDDKRPGQGAPFVSVQSVGNLDLSPEEATNWNAGLSWRSEYGTSIDVDYWHISFKDVIVQENAQDLADQVLIGGNTDLLGTQVILSQTGSLNGIISNYVNAAFIKTSGLDVTIKHVWDTEMGIFVAGAEATKVFTYDIPGLDGSTVKAVDRRNQQNFGNPIPDFRANFSLTWSKGIHSFAGYARYIDGFMDDQNSTFATLAGGTSDFNTVLSAAHIKSHMTFDAQYSLDLSEGTFFSNTVATIGAINLLNQAPPFVYTDGSFETRTHDPRGRMIYVRLTAAF